MLARTFHISLELTPRFIDLSLSERIDSVGFIEKLQPKFVAVVSKPVLYSSENQLATITWLDQHLSIPITPHIVCYQHTEESLSKTLDYYIQLGIQQLLLVTGDHSSDNDVFSNSIELIHFIKKNYANAFYIYVADYPDRYVYNSFNNSNSLYAVSSKNLLAKIQAGADAIITQCCFDSLSYIQYKQLLKNLAIDVPMIAMIPPVLDVSRLLAFVDHCKLYFPSVLRDYFTSSSKIKNNKAIYEHMLQLSQTLLRNKLSHLHFSSLQDFARLAGFINELEVVNKIPVST